MTTEIMKLCDTQLQPKALTVYTGQYGRNPMPSKKWHTEIWGGKQLNSLIWLFCLLYKTRTLLCTMVTTITSFLCQSSLFPVSLASYARLSFSLWLSCQLANLSTLCIILLLATLPRSSPGCPLATDQADLWPVIRLMIPLYLAILHLVQKPALQCKMQ